MPRRYVERGSVTRSIGTALERGRADALKWSRGRKGDYSPHSWKLDYSGNCRSPVFVFRDGVSLLRKENSRIYSRMTERPQLSEIEARCRKCPECLAARAAHWRMRAETEWLAANRTWFGTLTLSPEQHFRVASEARLRMSQNGDDFDCLDQEGQFLERHRIISKMLTDYVKRVRKESKASLRFLCVAEAHKTGLPHYHMLVHEVSSTAAVRHHTLRDQWRAGFSNWKLVADKRAASYVCKYLAKSSLARVRASIDYGNPTNVLQHSGPRPRETPSTLPEKVQQTIASGEASLLVSTLGRVTNVISG